MHSYFKNLNFVVVLIFAAFFISGCATYGTGIKACIENVEAANYQKAEEELNKALKPDGKDRLLYYMELGSIQRLGGKYPQSNLSFETAENFSEELYTKKAKDVLASMLLNPRQGSYPGNDLENIYLNYFKAINYMDMAMDAGCFNSSEEELFENAQVELKRLDYKLDSYEIQKGNYKNVKDKKETNFFNLLNIFNKFKGNLLDKDWLKFREDAHARYLSGVIYELSGDYDSARISYHNSAELYEQGYAKQYELDSEITERAWFDTIRMMIKTGNWENEWPQYAKEKLSPEKRIKLKNLSDKKGQIIVIEHFGFAPQKKELNLFLNAEPASQSLYLYPVLTGEPEERDDQRAWFFLLYADKGVFSAIKNYSNGGLYGVVKGIQRKTISLGPLWKVAQDMGLISAIGDTGIRINVPYYSPLRADTGISIIESGNMEKKLIRCEDLGKIVLQTQLLNAGKELNASLARAAMKSVIAFASASQFGQNAIVFGQLFSSLTSAAETRSWLMLPREIRINRFFVEPGEHEVQITTKTKNGTILDSRTKKFDVKEGEIKVWTKRTFNHSKKQEKK
ncbi:MAG: hypothetical protein CSA18_00315 [Deltaproteobacteria bacterium]|nr:MAG: hypothetical protein CSA18_00315 [Deltaproteobacteria bacterium]